MAKSPGLPSDPDWDPKKQMFDSQGRNLFGDGGVADGEADRSAVDGNQFASPAIQEERPYQPHGYETTYRSKGGRILLTGIVGASCSFIGALGTLFFVFFFTFGLLFLLLGFLFSLPAFWRGSGELRAMNAGAMEAGRKGMALWGYWLGIFGVVLSTFSVAYYFYTIISLIGS